MRDRTFIGVGKLCYEDGFSPFQINMDDAAEQSLFNERRKKLLKAGDELIEHHRLRGATEEVKQHKVGNYTKLLT